jgi:hypothetical protein
MFKHHGRVSEFLDQAVFALDSCKIQSVICRKLKVVDQLTCIGDLSNLVGVEAVPTFSSPSKDKLAGVSKRRTGTEVEEEEKHTGMIEGA